VAERFAALRGTPFQDGSKSRGLAWSDLCVLVRGNLRQTAAPLVEAFKARGIPYLVSGLNNLFETPEAHASAALFRFVAGAEGVELDALRNAWRVALPAVDPEALERALDYARAVQDEVAYDADEDAHALLPQRVFLEFLTQLGLREESAGGGGHGEAIFANLGVFSRVLQDFEALHHHTAAAAKYAQLVAFLGNVAKDQYAEGALDGARARPDAVRILTVHKAKGLQWPAVALVGLVEGRFPARRFAQDPRRKKFKDWWDLVPVEAVADGARYQGDLDDERRLFYVAVTRAQRWLMLSFAPSEQYSWQNKPSSFFRWACARPEVSTGDITPRAVERLPPSPRHGVDGVQLDFTTIKHLFECPRRFQLQALYGFSPAPEPAQGFGSSVHDALATLHTRALAGDAVSADHVPALVADHLRLPYATPGVFEDRRERMEGILRRYLERHADTLREVEFVEQAIELPMGEGVTVAGRIDLVVRRDDGGARIVDFKSSAHAQTETQTEAQLHLYALGYRALTGRDAAAVEVWELDHDMRHVSPVHDALLDGIRVMAVEAATMLREGAFPPKPDPERCGRCAMRGLCAAGAALFTASDAEGSVEGGESGA